MADALSPSAREETADTPPSADVLPGRRSELPVIDDAVRRLLEHAAFLAIIGPDRTACSVAADALMTALAAHAVRVLIVRGPDEDGLRLATLAGQLLGRAETAFDPDDIERLFDVLTDQSGTGRPVILIVDGAETLRQDAVNYLRLLSTLASEAAPQIVFCGQPGFWQVAEDLRTLIAAQWILTADDIPALRAALARAASGEAAVAETPTPQPTQSGTAASSEPTKPGLGFAIPLFDNYPGPSVLRVQAAPAPFPPGNPARSDLLPGAETLRVAEESADDDVLELTTPRPRRWPRAVIILAGLAIVAAVGAEASRRLDPSGPVGVLIDRHVSPMLDTLRDRVWFTGQGGPGAPADGRAADRAGEPTKPPPREADKPVGDSSPAASAATSVGPTQAGLGFATPAPAGARSASAVGPATSRPAGAKDSSIGPPGTAPGREPGAAADGAPRGAGNAPPDAAAPRPAGKASVAPAPAEAPPPAQAAIGTPVPAALKAESAGPPDSPPKADSGKQTDAAAKAAAADRPGTTPDADAMPRPDSAVRAESAAQADTAAKPDAPKADAGKGDPGAKPEPADVKALLARGDKLLALGDIAAARLLYERAASLGSGRAATSVGKTYDPSFLTTLKATGPRPDAGFAASWYRSGLTLGDTEAAALLNRLPGTGSAD